MQGLTWSLRRPVGGHTIDIVIQMRQSVVTSVVTSGMVHGYNSESWSWSGAQPHPGARDLGLHGDREASGGTSGGALRTA